MQKVKFSILLVLLFSLGVQAKSSFRLDNGNLLSVGKSKSEIIMLVGVPIYEDVEQIAIDSGVGDSSVKREILTYKLKGSIGGFYLVVVTVENNKVVYIESKQYNRI